MSVSVGFLGSCVKPDGNKPPNVPSIICPSEAGIDEEVAITAQSTDPDRDRISYKVAFGDGAESDWTDYLLSGQPTVFTHVYTQIGDFEVRAIASDTHHDNPGWSDPVTIKVLPRAPPIGAERVMFCVGPRDDFNRIAAMGVTIIQSYELPYIDMIDFLNRADALGMKVYFTIVSMVHNQILATGSWDKATVAEIIRKCRDHPALFCWQPIEEANLWNRDISHELQAEIYRFFKDRDPNHLVTQTLAGGASNWHKINFDAMDFITPDTYVYDGTGKMWGLEPLAYLAEVGRQERTYLDNKGITKPIMFIQQCCDEPATTRDPPIENSKVPLGHLEDQFNTLKPYGLFTGGLGWWAWNGGFFGPCTSSEMYEELRKLLAKIK